MGRRNHTSLKDDPLWYKDAIIYELHVRAFLDSSGDGMGDFQGLEQKLDYLQDLGITTIWLLPFTPSPWRDDGYDIADYTGVHPAYGTLRDFQSFLREAHSRGLRVITELVVNHTSDQHEWFRRARNSPPGSKWRDFYVWSDNPQKYSEARIIFKDTETSNWTWDPAAKAYYWHRFFSHQPDLNFDNPAVVRAVTEVLDFWLDMGVDGLRLDAVPYLIEREGTNCENLPETHAFLKELRCHMDQRYRNRMLLAEANQWPEDAVAYFGQGDESHMNFHFPVMPRLFMATRMEDRFPIVDILQQTPAIPDNCQWAMFLRNHDELTLEMVTDEERDYMYRVYANDPQARINLGIRRRLAPLLNFDRRRIELLNGLLLSLPGTPVIYYGDEIGMGDNFYLGDRNGVRTPMQWSADRNAGFSRANPQKLYLPVVIDPSAHYEAVNVDVQQNSPSSLLWWMKRIIALRKEHAAFGRGSLEFLHPENRKVLAFVRRYQEETILVVANLSRFAQPAELDLSAFQGLTPVELFGRTEFPPAGQNPYLLSLSPYGFYWFAFESRGVSVESTGQRPAEANVPMLTVGSWEEVYSDPARRALERALPDFLRGRRWFRGGSRRIRSCQIADIIEMQQSRATILLVNVEYSDGDPELYQVPVALASGEEFLRARAESALLRLRGPDHEEGVLFGALWDRAFGRELIEAVARRRRYRGQLGELVAAQSGVFREAGGTQDLPEPLVVRTAHSNSSVAFPERFIYKLFRKLELGPNPQLEVEHYLAARVGFPHVPRIAGLVEYRRGSESALAGILHTWVPNQGTAWSYTRDHLGAFFEAALARQERDGNAPELNPPALSLLDDPFPALALELIGPYLESARLIGRRVAELHLALATPTDDPAFAPEPFTDFYRNGLYHSMVGIASFSMQALRRAARTLEEPAQSEARRVLGLEGALKKRFQAVRARRFGVTRTRIHGDLHLGRLLYTGRDFQFIDFDGPAERPASERRIKRSPLRDVASMMRSFHYIAWAALFGEVPGISPRPEQREALERWARYWNRWVSLGFLREYLTVADGASFVPKTRESLAILLYSYLLEKALQEMAYETQHRPAWVRIPLHGIQQLMEAPWPE